MHCTFRHALVPISTVGPEEETLSYIEFNYFNKQDSPKLPPPPITRCTKVVGHPALRSRKKEKG